MPSVRFSSPRRDGSRTAYRLSEVGVLALLLWRLFYGQLRRGGQGVALASYLVGHSLAVASAVYLAYLPVKFVLSGEPVEVEEKKMDVRGPLESESETVGGARDKHFGSDPGHHTGGPEVQYVEASRSMGEQKSSADERCDRGQCSWLHADAGRFLRPVQWERRLDRRI